MKRPIDLDKAATVTPGTSLPSRSAEPRHATALSARHIVSRVGEVAFALWLILSLITPSWRYGPFAWLPLWQYEELAGAPMRVGAANLLPLIVVACLLLSRWRACPRPPWTWGPPALTLPLAGLTVLGTLSLDTGNFRHVFIYGGMYAVAWLVYLVVLNERPHLLVPSRLLLLKSWLDGRQKKQCSLRYKRRHTVRLEGLHLQLLKKQ